MPKYRKRPIVIEAAQIPTNSNTSRWAVFYDFLRLPSTTMNIRPTPDGGFAVTTLEGVMHANPGDWLICGIKGEIYPCKPDIFEATYEAVILQEPQRDEASFIKLVGDGCVSSRTEHLP